jgi:curved DNA-binding protein CbpA
VLQRHARLAQLNHFELLEVPEHASGASIRRAFQQAVLRFHPDRLRGEHERLRPLAKEIVCRIGLAYRVLEDDASREHYRRSLQQYPHLAAVHSSIPAPRPSSPALRLSSIPTVRPNSPSIRVSGAPAPAGAATLPPDGASLPLSTCSEELTPAQGRTAEQAFASAKIQLAHGAVEDALALSEQACRAEPGHPRYHALHAWIRAQQARLEPGPLVDDILMTLTWAMRERRTDLEIRAYRARVLQRLGRHEEAARDFSVIASMDSTNQEAIREVRLHRARLNQKTSASGLWKRFVKP